MLHQDESCLPQNHAPGMKEFAEMSKKVAGTGKTVGKAKTVATGKTTITLSSKNYSSWSLRGWLLVRFSGLELDEIVTSPDDASARAEILLLLPSILVL